MGQNNLCFYLPCLAVWLCLKTSYENMVLVRLLQIGAKEVTVPGMKKLWLVVTNPFNVFFTLHC